MHEAFLTRQPAAPFPLPLFPVAGTSKAEYSTFYGVGGGLEIMNVVPHASIIMLSDYLRTRLFAENLNSYRISTGLSWHFGSKTVK